MIKRYSAICLILCICFSLDAQKKPRKKDIIPIENLLSIDAYTQAIGQLTILQRKYPDDGHLHLLKGICYLNIDYKTDAAIVSLEKAVDELGMYSERNDHAIEANYHLAQAYHLTNRFEDALQILSTLSDTVPKNRTNIHSQIDLYIGYCKNAIELTSQPVDFRITNLGQAINSEYDEHSPVISGNEDLLMFTSNRLKRSKKQKNTILPPEDIYTSSWREGSWLPSVTANSNLNTDRYDATCSLSSDGKTLIIYRNQGNGDLFISQMDKEWSEPKRLPKPINSPYEESHASLSLDGNTIVFTSDRPNGIGQKDMYLSKKLPDGTWGKAQLFPESVNTQLNEESPFLSYDGNTLFFASEGHSSMGGFDIFKSEKLENGQWSKAQNIGYPINTPGDDLFYIPTLDGQRVYFASERPGGYGRSDIYIIEYPVYDERSLAVVAGYLFTIDGLPSSDSEISIHYKESNAHIGTYKPQRNTGKYTMILPTGVVYQMTIKTPGKTTINRVIEIPYQENYRSKTGATFLDPMVIK